MRPHARLLLPDGTLRTVAAGDLLGRMPGAALMLDDERVSEAHALFSLRGAELKVLSLRGRLIIDGKPATEAALEEGMVLEPAPGLEITVATVALPAAVLALSLPGLPPHIVSGTTSLLLQPRPTLAQRYHGDAAAWVWPVGDGFRLRVGAGAPQPLAIGDAFAVGGVRVAAVAATLAAAGREDTRGAPPTPLPLTVVTHYDVVHVWAEGGAEAHFDGQLARLLSEVASFGVPVAWEGVAAALWPGEGDRAALRSRWDVSLSRIRRRLRQAGLRDDLVRAAGIGLVELHLRPDDRLQDQG